MSPSVHGHVKCALCKLPAFSAQGAPVHERGISATCLGLFFLGLPWLSALKSALVAGVAEDARRIRWLDRG